jgi:hypothetical protein
VPVAGPTRFRVHDPAEYASLVEDQSPRAEALLPRAAGVTVHIQDGKTGMGCLLAAGSGLHLHHRDDGWQDEARAPHIENGFFGIGRGPRRSV